MQVFYTSWHNTLSGVDRSSRDEAVELLRAFIRHALDGFTPPSGSGETSLEDYLLAEAEIKLDAKLS